jgi:hypothetical protein
MSAINKAWNKFRIEVPYLRKTDKIPDCLHLFLSNIELKMELLYSVFVSYFIQSSIQFNFNLFIQLVYIDYYNKI